MLYGDAELKYTAICTGMSVSLISFIRKLNILQILHILFQINVGFFFTKFAAHTA